MLILFVTLSERGEKALVGLAQPSVSVKEARDISAHGQQRLAQYDHEVVREKQR